MSSFLWQKARGVQSKAKQGKRKEKRKKGRKKDEIINIGGKKAED